MNTLQTAFLALRYYCDRADIDPPTVTIVFPNRRAQAVFESLTRLDGLGYRHQFIAVSPREALKPGVDLQIAGIDICYENLQDRMIKFVK